jgi:Scd6-like Sm domain
MAMDHLIGCASSSCSYQLNFANLPTASASTSYRRAKFGRLAGWPHGIGRLTNSRYFGTLHEINPEQSTIALEDVYSYGTEGREPSADKFVSASQQKFDYIVFRGSDVKDIKIAEEGKETKPEPPNVLNDPAIVVSNLYPTSCASSLVTMLLLLKHNSYDETHRM